MFSTPANPYDEIVTKATDENLASEDWDINLQICDKVTAEGNTGARNAVGALTKRLSHRNPNVQLYSLELANTLVQNCGKQLHEELASRNWTTALSRLIDDRSTVEPVRRKALKYVKEWAQQFEKSGDTNLGLMSELYDQLRAKNLQFDEPEPAPETQEEIRRRREEEELARVIELSKQDKGGRGGAPAPAGQGSSGAVGSSGQGRVAAAVAAHSASQAGPQQPTATPYAPAYGAPAAAAYSNPVAGAAYSAPQPEQEQPPLDINTTSRVRALYTFESSEVGELNFERGDVIKVLDRGFKEWWRGASNGKIGIFPVTYVEALPEPTPRELQEEAQEEARVFASLGLVDQLLETLKKIDPSRGERIEDKPEVEEMYQASVALQSQINALIKKYSDQKAELEHMNNNFLRAMRQYEELRGGPPPQPFPYPQGQQPYPQQQPSGDQQYAPHQQQQSYHQSGDQYPQQQSQQYPQGQGPPPSGPPGPQMYSQYPTDSPAAMQQGPPQFPHPQTSTGPAQQPGQPGMYYQNPTSTTSLQRAPSGAPSFPPGSPPRQNSAPGAAGVGAGSGQGDADHQAAWDAYYRAQGMAQPPSGAPAGAPPQSGQQQQHPPQQQGYAPPQQQQQGYAPPQQYGAHPGVDAATQGMSRMSVGH